MLYTANQIRQIEQATQATLAPGSLMQAAGKAAAKKALSLLKKSDQSVLILAGPGNNGGDAFEVAVHLAAAKHKVFVLHHSSQSKKSSDAQRAFDQAKKCSKLTWLPSDTSLENHYALVIDGLFGIGLRQAEISMALQNQFKQINAMSCPILALDVSSGLDADTGSLLLTHAIQATDTITFITDKPGLHTHHGRDYAGLVEVADLGVDRSSFPPSHTQLNHTALFAEICRPRSHNSHKGSYGTVTVIGGALGMQGAAILASRAALLAGAGRVIVGFIDSPPQFDAQYPELMCRLATEMQLDLSTVIVIGPGLGNSNSGLDALQLALQNRNPIVIDADGLNLIAQYPELQQLCKSRDPLTTLITPHPLEAGRLLKCGAEAIQADRINAAKKLAHAYSAVVILKGSGSIIAHPDGHIVINPTGNPGLASGGTGDVLAGICGALIAQHRSTYQLVWQAALAATYFHGAAADRLVERGTGPIGLCANELLKEVRTQINSSN